MPTMKRSTMLFATFIIWLLLMSTIFALDRSDSAISGSNDQLTYKWLAGILGTGFVGLLIWTFNNIMRGQKWERQKIRILLHYMEKVCDKLEIDYDREDFR